jgi:V8-like Glu-specific endopeptidase
MTIFPPDTRQISTNFTAAPLNSVVAVDSQFQVVVNGVVTNTKNLIGTGIMISPNHILTASHIVIDTDTSSPSPLPIVNARSTLSSNQLALRSRNIGVLGDPIPNVPVRNIYFPRNATAPSIRINRQDDVALLTSTTTPISAQNAIGMIAFVDASTAVGLSITTAGYPDDRPLYTGRNLVVSSGTDTI